MSIRLEPIPGAVVTMDPIVIPAYPGVRQIIGRVRSSYNRPGEQDTEGNWTYVSSPYVAKRQCILLFRDSQFFIQDEEVRFLS